LNGKNELKIGEGRERRQIQMPAQLSFHWVSV
jgi:hypothetical protein